MTDAELIARLRQAASTWFKNSDLLLLEELIKRYRIKDRQHELEVQTRQKMYENPSD